MRPGVGWQRWALLPPTLLQAPFIKTPGEAERHASPSYIPHKADKQLYPLTGAMLGEQRKAQKGRENGSFVPTLRERAAALCGEHHTGPYGMLLPLAGRVLPSPASAGKVAVQEQRATGM